METKVWRNMDNGHHFAIGPNGWELNGFRTNVAPEWAQGRAPDEIYGQMIEWAGGACPVDPDTNVRCIFRGRRPYIGKAIWPELPDSAKSAMWHHAPHGPRSDPAYDIVAYQVAV